MAELQMMQALSGADARLRVASGFADALFLSQ
jgi:hypothetical protein